MTNLLTSNTRSKPKQVRSQATLDLILDAIERLYDREARNDLSTKKLSNEAGIAVGTLYRFFPTIEAAEAACAERIMDNINADLIAIIENHGEPDARLSDVLIDGLIERLLHSKMRIELFRSAMVNRHYLQARLAKRDRFILTFFEAIKTNSPNNDLQTDDNHHKILIEVGGAYQKLILFSDIEEERRIYASAWKRFVQQSITGASYAR
ncbi:MAG: TetR/AcrR family transcriptional regulator [Jannaschia sp.]